jgi:nicotinate-nucleotide pyrophosphorylase (carboxylating)
VFPIPYGRGTGFITAAIARGHKVGGLSLRLDIRMRDEDEGNEAIAACANVVMLNNIEGSKLGSVAQRLRERAIAGKWTPRTFAAVDHFMHFMRVEIDILSASAVHWPVPHIDFGLKIQKPRT